MKGKNFLLFLIYFFACGHLSAQNPTFNYQKLGSEEGLNSNNILNIEQHPNGLIYVTTQNGIYFYYGTEFYKLKIDSVRSNELITASVRNPDELFLSVNNKGIASFHTGSKTYQLLPQLKIGNNNADKIIVNGDFIYLLNSQTNLSIYNLKTGEKISSDRDSKNRTTLPYCIFKTSGNQVLVGRSDGLYEVNGGRQVRMELLKNTTVNSIAEMKDGTLVAGINNKIVFVKNNIIVKEFTPKLKASTYNVGGEKSVDKIIADDFGRIWFTVYPNENLFLLQNDVVYDVFDLLGLQPELILCLFKDKNQNLWIGTFDDGVYYIQNTFMNTLAWSFNGKTVPVNKLLLKDGMLAAATGNGLFAFDLRSGKTTGISNPGEPVTSIVQNGDNIFYSRRVVFEAKAFQYKEGGRQFTFKPVESTRLIGYHENGLIVVDRFSRDILLYDITESRIKDTLISFPDYTIQVYDLLVKGEKLFVASNSGLFEYDFREKKYNASGIKELSMKLSDLDEIDGQIYAAHESGITRISDGKLISQVGNLRLNGVKKITVYQEKIWIATLDGVIICDKNFSPLKVMNKFFGLPSNNVNDLEFSENLVGIATAKGLTTIDVKSLLDFNSALPPVTIDHIQVNGKEISYGNHEIQLKADEDNLNIRFFSPFFNSRNKQSYRYRFDNGEWIGINDNSFGYSISSGGKHQFEISATIDRITWSEPTVVNINKEEKLSESSLIYWLITFGGLLIIAGVSFYVIRRVHARAIKRLEEERQVNLLKHQAMNSLLSPHFIFNSLTSIQNYINSNNSLKASEYLAKFSRLIRMIIEKAAQSEITLQDELTRLSYYLELEKERFKNKFDFFIDVDENLNRAEIKIPNMIIQPHAENCIIHGILPKLEHGTLTIRFTKTPENKLLIKIEDDGIGLIKAKEHAKTGHKSLGTATIRNILEINSKLTGKTQTVSMVDKSTLTPPGQGTLITIELGL